MIRSPDICFRQKLDSRAEREQNAARVMCDHYDATGRRIDTNARVMEGFATRVLNREIIRHTGARATRASRSTQTRGCFVLRTNPAAAAATAAPAPAAARPARAIATSAPAIADAGRTARTLDAVAVPCEQSRGTCVPVTVYSFSTRTSFHPIFPQVFPRYPIRLIEELRSQSPLTRLQAREGSWARGSDNSRSNRWLLISTRTFLR